MRPQYRINPSVLKAFQDLIDYEIKADEPWNKISQTAIDNGYYRGCHAGDFILTPDEMALKLEVDLINMINRVEKGPMEAADKGTAFNEVIDCIIEGRETDREGNLVYPVGWPTERYGDIYRATLNGKVYKFEKKLCDKVAAMFPGSLTQYETHAILDTKYGPAELYGYIDEWVGSMMYDIKTTSSYTFGNYEKGWQHHLYPWTAVQSGLATKIDEFAYVVVEWRKTYDILRAKNIYIESYTYDHERSGRKLLEICEMFIAWLERRKKYIQNVKIFGGIGDRNWHGVPLYNKEINELMEENAK